MYIAKNDEEHKYLNIHGCFHTIDHINWMCKNVIMIKGPRSQSQKYAHALSLKRIDRIYFSFITNYRNQQSILYSQV